MLKISLKFTGELRFFVTIYNCIAGTAWSQKGRIIIKSH